MSSNNTEQLQVFSNADNQDLQLITEPLAIGTSGPFLAAVERLGISELPWIMSLAHVDLALSPQQKTSLVNQITSAEKEIKHWIQNPFSKDSRNSKAALVIGVIATYSLLTAIQLNPTLSHNTCGPSPQPDGCIKLVGNSTDSIIKLYDWPIMIKKVLSALSEMLENPKEQQTADKFFSALEQGDDDLGYLYGIFQKSKNSSKASRIVANFALAAAGLCAALEGTEILEKWGRADKQMGAEYLQQQREANPSVGPQALLLPLHQALAVSPLLLLQTRDAMGKHVARHWHLLMWKHLGCQRPPLLGLLENIIWTTLCQVAARPKEIPQAMASLYEHLKEMTRYDKENNTFELEVEPGCREFYKSLEPLFYVPTSVNEGPALAQPAPAPRTPQTPPSNTSTHPPAAGPSGLNALRGNSPPPDGPLSPLANTGLNPDTEIGKGDNNGGGQDEPRADKGDAGKGDGGGSQGPRGGGKRKCGDDDNDERDDDADRTEDPDINLDAGTVGGGQEPIGSSKRRRGDDDAEDLGLVIAPPQPGDVKVELLF